MCVINDIIPYIVKLDAQNRQRRLKRIQDRLEFNKMLLAEAQDEMNDTQKEYEIHIKDQTWERKEHERRRQSLLQMMALDREEVEEYKSHVSELQNELELELKVRKERADTIRETLYNI